MTKNKLIHLTQEHLAKLGYKFVKDSITGAQGLFLKKIDEKYFVTLGLTISQYYPEMFTASFYLSKVTIWGAIWGDIPRESYERIGKFLSNDERILLLEDRFLLPEVVDSWWRADETGIKNFLAVLKLTESRFLNQQDLFRKIENSQDIEELSNLSNKVIKRYDTDNDYPYDLMYTPLKSIDNIPEKWFKVAEKVIIDEKKILNINTVKRLAADAYRQKLITDGLSGASMLGLQS